jgi:hypothetical protein
MRFRFSSDANVDLFLMWVRAASIATHVDCLSTHQLPGKHTSHALCLFTAQPAQVNKFLFVGHCRAFRCSLHTPSLAPWSLTRLRPCPWQPAPASQPSLRLYAFLWLLCDCGHELRSQSQHSNYLAEHAQGSGGVWARVTKKLGR